MSPIQYAPDDAHRPVGGGVRVGWFEGGGHPSGVLTNKDAKEIKQEQAQSVKARFMAAVRGSHEPVVLAGGWDYTQISVKAEESQVPEHDAGRRRHLQVFLDETADGIAPSGSAITHANVEDNSLDFLDVPDDAVDVEYEERWRSSSRRRST